MLRLFIPQKIRGITLISTRYLAIKITKSSVYATMLLVQREGIEIVTTVRQELELQNYEDLLIAQEAALRAILERVGKYDVLIGCLDSTLCVFKPVRLPFVSEEKAKLVIGNELEPSLPYKFSSAVVDCLTTSVNQQDSSSQVLGVAAQKSDVEALLAIFTAASVKPDVLTTDVCALYNLSQYIPGLTAEKSSVILIYIGEYSTTLLMVQGGAYRACRSFPRGAISIAQDYAKKTSQTTQQVLTTISEHRSDSPESHEVLASFWDELAFTIQSLLQHVANKEEGVTLYIAGHGVNVTTLCRLATNKTGWSCSQIPVELQNPEGGEKIINNSRTEFAITTGSALPLPQEREFNLLRQEFTPSQAGGIIKTLAIVSSIALITILGAVAINWFRISSLYGTLENGASSAIDELKESFSEQEIKELGKPIPQPVKSLEGLVKKAKNTVKKQEETWQAFTRSSHSPYLRYLYLLFNELDKKALGLEIERLVIIDNVITLDGSVRDYDALALLDRKLSESAHFSIISGSLQEPTFRIELIVHDEQG